MQAQDTGSPKKQKFAINRALEQKLIGPLEKSHTEELSPKNVSEMEFQERRSKIAVKGARTRV